MHIILYSKNIFSISICKKNNNIWFYTCDIILAGAQSTCVLNELGMSSLLNLFNCTGTEPTVLNCTLSANICSTTYQAGVICQPGNVMYGSHG